MEATFGATGQVAMKYNTQFDHQALELLHASDRDVRRVIARTVELIGETERLLDWMHRLSSPLLGFTPPSADRGTARGTGR
jgi:hypothetical protein